MTSVSINISKLNYVPTLAIRPSEMTGLEELPEATKDRIQPIFLLAPWGRAKKLQKAIERIEKAFPARPYFLDIDRYYEPSNLISEAQVEWKSLLNSENSYINWVNVIKDNTYANPCVQIGSRNIDIIKAQVNEFQKIGKSFVFRFELSHWPKIFNEIIDMINNIGTADHIIVLDAGWTNDSLSTRLLLKNIVSKNLIKISADIPIVISYTMIPKSYTGVNGIKLFPFDNREAVRDIQAATNHQKIIYGDWASTRPRENSGGRYPRPRIDIPYKNGWITARQEDNEWSFPQAAETITNTPQWQAIKDANIWGTFRILQTLENSTIKSTYDASESTVGINSPQSNVAVRVNIHLHLQAFYDTDNLSSLNLDEDWED